MAVDNGLSLVKPFKRLMARFQAPSPPRGRIDPHHPSVIQPPSAPQEPLPPQVVGGGVDMINANAVALEAMAKAEAKIPPQPRRQGPPPPPQQGTVDPYAGNTVSSEAVKVVALEDFKETKAKPGDNQWSSWRGYLDSISLERVEKPLKRFMAIFKTPQAVDPYQDRTRGQVDPNNTVANLTARAREAEAKEANTARMEEAKKKANAENRPGMFVHRAKTGNWEDFKDAVVKEGQPVDDEAKPPDKVQSAGDFNG